MRAIAISGMPLPFALYATELQFGLLARRRTLGSRSERENQARTGS
jgi:hypothetical protein